MPEIRAVLFDMDGVLIDAKDWHYESLNEALALFGMEIDRHEHLTTYDGLPTRRKLEMLTEERGLPTQLHEFINTIKQRNTSAMAHARCKPIFTHEYALSRLKREGYRLAVCSNSVRASVELMISKAMLTQYFDVILSNEDVIKAKPDPQIYLTAMERLGVEPEESLILEDNEHGIKSAISSGANLMRIGTVDDVNYFAIRSKIAEIEGT